MNVEILTKADDPTHGNTHRRSFRALEPRTRPPTHRVLQDIYPPHADSRCGPATIVLWSGRNGAFPVVLWQLYCGTTFTSVSQFSPFLRGATTIPERGTSNGHTTSVEKLAETDRNQKTPGNLRSWKLMSHFPETHTDLHCTETFGNILCMQWCRLITLVWFLEIQKLFGRFPEVVR